VPRGEGAGEFFEFPPVRCRPHPFPRPSFSSARHRAPCARSRVPSARSRLSRARRISHAHDVGCPPHGVVSHAHDATLMRTMWATLRTESSLTRTTHLSRARCGLPSARSRLSRARWGSHPREEVRHLPLSKPKGAIRRHQEPHDVRIESGSRPSPSSRFDRHNCPSSQCSFGWTG